VDEKAIRRRQQQRENRLTQQAKSLIFSEMKNKKMA
jgi:hypothetical protein